MEESVYWKKRIAAASTIDNPKEILKKDMSIVKKLKKENANLKEEIRKITKNNEKFTKLVETMETKIMKMSEDVKKNYVYSFEKGGWAERGSMDKDKIEIAPSQLNVDSINNQLSEILRMIQRNKIKD
ncbi:MAG: hypothetical protein KAS04_06735 [Candidatus Aenigmarchaeota archaeon]|nr:hypothetical protein [Candidatus Aenigmarchaeota archaeon]